MRIPRWSTLRPVGNSLLVRLTVIIPLVGYLIIFNEKLVEYIKLVREVAGISLNTTDLPVHPRLLQIYFGLCLIAAASALYSFRCPPTIKRNGTSAEFVGSDGSHLGDYLLKQIERQVASSQFGDTYRSEKRRFETSVGGARVPVPGTPEFSRIEYQVNNMLLHMFYAYENSKYPFWRAAASMFFALGFVALLLPSIKIFWNVIIILIGLLWRNGPLVLWS